MPGISDGTWLSINNKIITQKSQCLYPGEDVPLISHNNKSIPEL